MSIKRQATSDLNHENWDQEDPADGKADESEGFKIATRDILEKRVIRTAKRRSQNTGVEGKKSVFSGFSGFNKTQQTSFDFLANLTNGSKSSSTSVFGSSDTKTTSISNPGLFSTTTSPKTTLDKTSESSVFGGSFGKSNTELSMFSSKAESTLKENPLKLQNNSTTLSGFAVKPNTNSSPFATAQVPSNIFGMNSGNSLMSKTIENNSTPFKIQPVSTATQEFPVEKKATNVSNENNDKKYNYYNKLKGLNESVSDWIKNHVEKTPLCILSPIFKDYEEHLKDIQNEYESSNSPSDKIIEASSKDNTVTNFTSLPKSPENPIVSSLFSNTSTNKSLFSTNTQEKSSGFSFGLSTGSSTAVTTTAGANQNTTFSFGVKSSPPTSSSTIPSIASGTNGTPFSFGIGKPFSFNSNIKTPEEQIKQDDENEDEPPKVEFTPVVEENSVYDKKCKVFVKKDGNFIDKGVGTLYIKKIEDSGKHQLLVRANTSLGNVMLNMILSSSLPTQRMGKNNVMIMCIPTPEAKPPPVPILIRVKTPEEADELLTTLDKFKA